MIPLVAIALLLIVVSGSDRLANREIPGAEAVGLTYRERITDQ